MKNCEIGFYLFFFTKLRFLFVCLFPFFSRACNLNSQRNLLNIAAVVLYSVCFGCCCCFGVCVWRLFVVKVIKLRPSITWENARGAVCRRLIYRRAIFNDCDGTWHLSCVCCMVVGFRQLGLRVNWGVLYIFMALDFLVGYDSQRSHRERERVHKRCVGVLVSSLRVEFGVPSRLLHFFASHTSHCFLRFYFIFLRPFECVRTKCSTCTSSWRANWL